MTQELSPFEDHFVDLTEMVGIWETLNNPAFNPIEIDGIRKAAGLDSSILAATAHFNSGQRVEDHLVEITEMIIIGSGAERPVRTVTMSRQTRPGGTGRDACIAPVKAYQPDSKARVKA